MRFGLKQTVLATLAFSSILFLCGCDAEPITSLCWSPDGERGALDIPGQGIRLIGPEGEKSLTDILLPDAVSVAWENDKNHLLAVTEKNEKDWGKLKELIDKEEQAKIIEATQEILRLQKKYGSLKSEDGIPKEDSEKIKAMIKEIRLGDVLTYMFSVDPAALATFMKENDKKADEWSCPVYSLKRYSVKKNSIEAESTICTTRETLKEYATSPNGKAVAVVSSKTWGDPMPNYLKLYPSSGGEPRIVDEFAGDRGSIAWLAENNWLFSTDSNVVTGRKIMDENGNLLENPDATFVLEAEGVGRIVCRNENQIFFSAPKVTYPGPIGQSQGPHSLFMLRPTETWAPAEILNGTLNGNCKDFDISPDGKSIATMQEDGKVDLVRMRDMEGGTIQEIPFAKEQANLSRIMPRFRNNDELSFCVPVKSEESDKSEKANAAKSAQKGAELVIYSIKSGKSRTISKSWTAEVAPFLMKYVEEEKEGSDDKQEK